MSGHLNAIIFRETNLVPRCQIVANLFLLEQLGQVGVVQGPPLRDTLIRVHNASTFFEDAIDLARLLLCQRHENDWAFRYDCVDDECGEDHDEDRAEGKAEVTLASSHILH